MKRATIRDGALPCSAVARTPTSQASAKLRDLERVEVNTRAGWRAWLARHHLESRGAWVVTWKKRSGGPHVPYPDLVEEALCFGWIDSRPAKLDEQRTMLLFTPRKPQSKWAATNKARVARLVRDAQMAPRGLELVALAKRTGTWDALDVVDRLEVPPDLVRALAAHPLAAAHFEAFPLSAKRGILEWILQAKRPETRARRIGETALLAARNERANTWKPR